MKINKKNKKEVLIKFNQVNNPKELDEMLYQFERNMNNKKYNYFLKESENPFIFFIEYPQPDELIKEITYSHDINYINEILPVTCVLNNMNYITATILKKIRHKISYNDTFNVTCHMDTYSSLYNTYEIENELIYRLQEIIGIPVSKNDPMWNIQIHIIGEICAINISRSNKNRNKFSQYT